MIFFYAPSSCSMASHLALEQSGVAYEARRVDFSQNEQRSEAFLALNPKGRVPALLTEQGVLTETPAILAFISQSFPEAHLAPVEDPFRFAEAQAFNSYLCSTVHVAHAHRLRGARWADDPLAIEAMQKKVPQNMSDCFALIEQHLISGPYVLGETYSICDMYLFTICQWLERDGVDIRLFPKVEQLCQRMLENPLVARITALYAAA